jgi:hypothetical protein
MGTTLAQLQTGQARVKWVAAIYGYPHLLTDATTSAAITAWSGTGWTQAIGGLVVDGQWKQSIDPYKPFQPGGTIQLFIPDSDADTLGVDVFKAPGAASVKTELTATADNGALTLTVRDTTNFGASGELSIGTERISYTGKTATTFTGCTRGLYAPFKADALAQRFGSYHRVGAYSSSSPALEPVVTADHRTWKGRHVGLWMHRDVGGTLDTRAEAQCCFAGRIIEVRDDPNGLGTVLILEHVLDGVAEAGLVTDQFRGTLSQGVYIADGDQFDCAMLRASTGFNADPLVGTVGASTAYEIEPGYYPLGDICSKLNEWLATAFSAGDIVASMNFASPVDSGDGLRTVLSWQMTSTGVGQNAAIGVSGPPRVWRFLGFYPALAASQGTIEAGGTAGQAYELVGEEEPYVTMYDQPITFEATQGIFVSQISFLPNVGGWQLTNPAGDWGLFSMDGIILLGRRTSSTTLADVVRLQELETDGPRDFTAREYGRRASQSPEIELVQIFILHGAVGELLPALFLSTGTTGYNHATHDSLGRGLGLGIPWELLGDDFVTDCSMLEQSASTITIILDRPAKFSDVIGSDLVLRRSHLVWKNGAMRLVSWSTPVLANAQHALDDGNKAVPFGTEENSRTAATITEEWHRDLIKIQFNRSMTTGEYRSVMVLEDRTSIDDNGGQPHPVTIPARNAFGGPSGLNAGPQVELLIPGFLAWMPFFSRPYRKLRRSIDMRYFEGVAPGDVVTLTDPYTRDPVTGTRGVDNVVGLVVGHSFDWGGAEAGDPTRVRPMVGEIDIIILDTDRTFAYAPAARVDSTVTGGGFAGGYNAGTKTLRCRSHEYSYSLFEATDPENFSAGDVIKVVQMDESGGLSWTDTVVSASGTDIVLTTGLAGWDSTKQYRLTYADYGSATTAQRAKAFEADDADNRIVNLAAPNEYGADPSTTTFTLGSHTVAVARIYSQFYGDGAAHDSGTDMELSRFLDSMIDHKTAQNTPIIDNEALPKVGALWTATRIMPQFVGQQVPDGVNVERSVMVAPFMRSTDGLTASVRVTLSTMPPTDAPGEAQFVNVIFSQPYAQATFTSSSTSYATATAQAIETSMAFVNAPIWVTIECSENAAERGLGRFSLLERGT